MGGLMEFDTPDGGNLRTNLTQENGLILRPVSPEKTGVGLPYAPENWPNPGDKWGWRTGRRVALDGHFRDRYLYLPNRFGRPQDLHNYPFKSKVSIEQYIQTEFPGTDVDAFSASFSWKIPAKVNHMKNGNVRQLVLCTGPHGQTAEHSASHSQSNIMGCKAGNKACNSLIVEENQKSLPAMPCDICCNETGFCRECCCILCGKTVNTASGGYSYIKCQEKVSGNYICGHVAHVDCALRSCMAGTLEGNIGMDAEYYCRRCDRRTDMVSHVKRLLLTVESIGSQDDTEKILNLAVRLLSGSQKTIAKELLSHISLAISKLKYGAHFEDIWKVDDNRSAGILNHGNVEMKVINDGCPSDFIKSTQENSCKSFHDRSKLEDEINQVLQALRKSQNDEYNVAEERLHAQNSYLHNLYQQLDMEKSELASQTSFSNPGSLLSAIKDREDQLRRELEKLQDMEKIGNGFGRTSRDILQKHFGLDIED
ncbi:Protein OBERON 1-like [Quillaja saponaria]|uniref:Protein OBERON 1-like n=1 Tax=Quillaja saponaria TaxID=32244 RepID=A0AAD7QEK4_QUISA|nr:Protein OBERON 1-like [Quillaja saponaria]